MQKGHIMLGSTSSKTLIVLIVLAGASAAWGELLTFEARGTLNEVELDDLFPLSGFDGVGVGDEFSVTYAFYSDAIDLNPESPDYGYYQPLTAVTLELGERVVELDMTSADACIQVMNDAAYGGPDPWDGYHLADASYHSIDGYSCWVRLGIILDDWQAKVFASDALPASPPNLDAFDDRGFYFIVTDTASETSFDAEGEVLTLVPEPSTALLALLLAAFARRAPDRAVQ